MQFVWLLLAIAVCVGAGWFAFHMEPHWVSKDGARFLTVGQKLDDRGEQLTRWREMRVIVARTGRIEVEEKRFMRRHLSYWTLEAEAPEAPRRKVVFVLRGHDDRGVPILLSLRMPASSRAVGVLRPLLVRRTRDAPRSDAD